MHRQYQEICKAQQEASVRNKLLLEDVNRLQRQFSTPARSKLQQLKSRYEEEIAKLYPAWLEQVQQFRRQKEIAPLSGASQQPNSSHTLFVAPITSSPTSCVTITKVVTNSNSSYVSSESLTTPTNGYSPSTKPIADGNHSNQIQENLVSQDHTPQHSDISLASLSSGSLDHMQHKPIVHSTTSTGHIPGNHLSGSHDLSASHDLSISHDVVSSEDDDFWNSEAPPITSAAAHLPATTITQVTTVDSTSNVALLTYTSATTAPPTSTVATTTFPTYAVVTSAPPTSFTATAAPPTCSSTEILPISSSAVTTSTIPTRTNVASLFVATTTTPIANVATPTSSSSIVVMPISSAVISAASPVSSSTLATPIMSAVNSSESATPVTDAVTASTSNVMPVTASADSSSESTTPISGNATPPKLSLLSRPAASDSTNQNAVHQPSTAVLESSTSAGFKEHVPLTETAAYQSLARSMHHHDNSSSEISEGSAVLELEQLNTPSPGVTSSCRQEGSPLHSDDNTQGVKMTQLVIMDSDDESSVSLLPSGGGGGYVPSTLEQHTHKRTTPTSHRVDLKKLGILGGSDEEVNELPPAPTEETTQSNQLDEFDFYN